MGCSLGGVVGGEGTSSFGLSLMAVSRQGERVALLAPVLQWYTMTARGARGERKGGRPAAESLSLQHENQKAARRGERLDFCLFRRSTMKARPRTAASKKRIMRRKAQRRAGN